LSFDNIVRTQQQDQNIKEIINKLQQNDVTKEQFAMQESTGLLIKKVKNKSKSKILHKIFLPQQLIKTCIESAHKSHFGITKTYQIMSMYYFWNSMYKELLFDM